MNQQHLVISLDLSISLNYLPQPPSVWNASPILDLLLVGLALGIMLLLLGLVTEGVLGGGGTAFGVSS